MNSAEYAEKLKDPRWQKKRLQVFESAGWKCEYCGREDLPLHVHHLKYTGEPWDAPMEDLECLCPYHHELRTADALTLRFCTVRAKDVLEFLTAKTAALARGMTPTEIIKAMTEALRER